MSKPKGIYIISYEEDGRHGHGAFRSVQFRCVNTSVPRIKNDTVTYSVEKFDGSFDLVTVSLEHTIQTEP